MNKAQSSQQWDIPSEILLLENKSTLELTTKPQLSFLFNIDYTLHEYLNVASCPTVLVTG
jgi:hypothetical protein